MIAIKLVSPRYCLLLPLSRISGCVGEILDADDSATMCVSLGMLYAAQQGPDEGLVTSGMSRSLNARFGAQAAIHTADNYIAQQLKHRQTQATTHDTGSREAVHDEESDAQDESNGLVVATAQLALDDDDEL